MSYELSFSDGFYSNDGDANGVPQCDAEGRPTTLHSAIVALLATPSHERRRLCLAFKSSVAALQNDVPRVMDRAREINTCASIGRNGVPVYLTRGDWALTVTVY